MERVPVVIVGGGPVGLAAALELSRYGVGSLLVERHDRTTWHPKARNLNTRTMEIARGWGSTVRDELVSVNLPPGWTSQIIYTRMLAGEELGRMATAGFSGRGPDVSPEIPLLSSQDIFEPIMRRGVEAMGLADVRFGHEAGRIERGASEEDDRVVVEVKERSSGRSYGNFLGMELGFSYESAAVVPDGSEPPEVEDAVIDYVATGRPGHRAPHVWLEREGKRSSTLDLFGGGFMLLAGVGGREWVVGAAEAGKRFGIEIEAHAIGNSGDYVDADGGWGKQYGVADGGALLVRPDGHVAWRAADGCAVAPTEVLAGVLGQVLARSGDGL